LLITDYRKPEGNTNNQEAKSQKIKKIKYYARNREFGIQSEMQSQRSIKIAIVRTTENEKAAAK
jgi:hypothetical protein